MTWLQKISFFKSFGFQNSSLKSWCATNLIGRCQWSKSILTEKSRFWQGCLQISETKSSVPKTKFLTYWFPHLTISVKLHSRTLRISSLVISWTRPYLQPHSSLKLINSSKNVSTFSHYLGFSITSSAMRNFFWNFIWFSNRVRESQSRQQSANRDARRASFIWKLSWASCIGWPQ